MNSERKGEFLALSNSVLEGVFPVLAIYPVAVIGALHTYGFVVTVATAVLLLILGRRGELCTLFRGDAQKDLLLTSVTITLFLSLIFLSLRYTTAGNLAVLIFLQVFFSYLYFNVFGRDHLTALHTVGALVMVAGALVILFPGDFRFNRGDLLALLAAAIGPVANLFQKRARSRVGSITVLVYRGLFSIPVLFALAWLFEPPLLYDRFLDALPSLLAIGLLVLVLAKIFWVEALHCISITKLTAMTALIPIFTLLFAFIFLSEVPGLRQMVGIVPVLLGGYLITRPLKEQAASSMAG